MTDTRGSFRQQNMDVYNKNLRTHNKEWLENYKYGKTKDNKTVFTTEVSMDERDGTRKHYVVPQVLYIDGRLQEVGADYAIDNHRYGIPFDNKEDAHNFSLWLSNHHKRKGLMKNIVKKASK